MREPIKSLLETAAEQAADGRHKKAVDTLWIAEAEARTDASSTQALVELVSGLHAKTAGRVRNQYDEVLERAQATLQEIERKEHALATSHHRDAVAVVPRCRILGGHGLEPQAGETWELVFTGEAIRLVDVVGYETTIPFNEVTAIEVGGPGVRRRGGGFVGGGFGLQGAAEGMLIASALNMLTTRTAISTVICIQTPSAELFLHSTEATPDDLRIRLSPAFTAVRQRQAGASKPSHAGDPLDRLERLAKLRDSGVLTEEEFQAARAPLVRQLAEGSSSG